MRDMYYIILAVIMLVLSACTEPEPIRIGFAGELTTRAAGLGTSGRDGFLLAIEEVNSQGGINGRPVEALVQDTLMERESALHAVRKLTEAKVVAIIGPMTSQTAVTILPEINRARIPLISPTASTNQLSGLDDYFFRVYYTNAQAAQLLAKRLSAQNDSLHVAAIYDLGNRAYTEDWVKYFQETLQINGDAAVSRIPFDLRTETLFLDLAKNTIAIKPDGILILANAVDTAMICQQLAKLKSDLPVYATGWSYSDDLLQFGGKSVEGLTIIQSADLQETSPAMRKFLANYQTRYRTAPNFPAIHAYDATRLLLSVLPKSTQPEKIKEELLKTRHFSGLQADLSVDQYGDLKNPQLHLARISNGQFVMMD